MNIQTIVRSLRGQVNTTDNLRQTLDAIDIEGLEKAAELLEADRRRVLLDGTDKDLEAIEAKIASANRDIERAYAAKDELNKRLEEAASAATEAERVDSYRIAKAKADAAAKMVRKEYPELGRRFAELLRLVAEADIAVLDVNQRLPADAAPLTSPEFLARGLPGLPDQVLDETEVDLWCHAGTSNILPDDIQNQLADSSGMVTVPFHGYMAEKRRFTRRTSLPRINAARPQPLSDIALPGLVVGDPPYWDPKGHAMDARRILGRLSEIAGMKASNPPQREPKIEFIPVRD